MDLVKLQIGLALFQANSPLAVNAVGAIEGTRTREKSAVVQSQTLPVALVTSGNGYKFEQIEISGRRTKRRYAGAFTPAPGETVKYIQRFGDYLGVLSQTEESGILRMFKRGTHKEFKLIKVLSAPAQMEFGASGDKSIRVFNKKLGKVTENLQGLEIEIVSEFPRRGFCSDASWQLAVKAATRLSEFGVRPPHSNSSFWEFTPQLLQKERGGAMGCVSGDGSSIVVLARRGNTNAAVAVSELNRWRVTELTRGHVESLSIWNRHALLVERTERGSVCRIYSITTGNLITEFPALLIG